MGSRGTHADLWRGSGDPAARCNVVCPAVHAVVSDEETELMHPLQLFLGALLLAFTLDEFLSMVQWIVSQE